MRFDQHGSPARNGSSKHGGNQPERRCTVNILIWSVTSGLVGERRFWDFHSQRTRRERYQEFSRRLGLLAGNATVDS
jgi:hypothetical protein